MAEGGEKKKGFSRGWSIFRWPLMLGALIVSAVIFMIGLACSVGYTGTTPLKALNNSGSDLASWNQFKTLFINTDTGDPLFKGTPYLLLDRSKVQAKESQSVINMDKRLVRALSYVGKEGDLLKQACGWNILPLSDPKHDRIAINTNLSDYASDLSDPEPIVKSNSTLNRGVGARITGADLIKCSYQKLPPPQCAVGDCPPACDSLWYKHSKFNILFSGTYSKQAILYPIDLQCTINIDCAVDYFPHLPSGEAAPREELSELNPGTTDNGLTAPLNPNVMHFGPAIDMVALQSFAKDAAVYKTAQLALHLMTFDYPGCEKPGGNVGNQRNTPTSIIFARWIAEEMKRKNVWDGFMSLANGKNSSYSDYAAFPYHLQTESPLAGLSFDSKLNGKAGLHFNY